MSYVAKLTAKQLKALPDSMFGLPKTRQYPMPDKAHVIKAIQFFKFCPDKDKPELAKNINRRAKELKMQVKVQPSSAFYKYADKSILKEAMVIQEFHIGQLSPIVTIEPQVIKMNFGNGRMDENNGPLDRLQRLWASAKSNDAKAEETAKIVSEAINNGATIDAITYSKINELDNLWYMQNSWAKSLNMSFSDRNSERMSESVKLLQDNIRAHDVEAIIKILNSMSGTMLASSLALVNYTTDLDDNQKSYINSKVNMYRSNTDILANISFPNIMDNSLRTFNDGNNFSYRMSDDDIYIIDSFVNMLSDECLLGSGLHALARKKFQDQMIWDGCIVQSTPPESYSVFKQIDCLGYARGNTDYGYYRKNMQSCCYDFLKMGDKGDIYVVAEIFPSRPKQDMNRHMFMVKIHDRNDQEYNNRVLTHFLGSKEPITVITRVVTINLHKPSLEATDFKALYNGIQISNNGNVSFMLDELQPWGDKYSLCKQMMERNLKDKEYEHYKNNLCALYSLINVIYNRYNPALADDSQEAKTALGVMDKSMSLFKDGIGNMAKIQPEFNFIDYYMSSHYNDKLSVFKSLDDKELRDEATIAYGWIMQ